MIGRKIIIYCCLLQAFSTFLFAPPNSSFTLHTNGATSMTVMNLPSKLTCFFSTSRADPGDDGTPTHEVVEPINVATEDQFDHTVITNRKQRQLLAQFICSGIQIFQSGTTQKPGDANEWIPFLRNALATEFQARAADYAFFLALELASYDTAVANHVELVALLTTLNHHAGAATLDDWQDDEYTAEEIQQLTTNQKRRNTLPGLDDWEHGEDTLATPQTATVFDVQR